MSDVKLLAQQIAAGLFTNGRGQEADRLVLELPGKRDGGGWCRKAVEYQIADAIAAWKAPALTPKQQAADEMYEALKVLTSDCLRWSGTGSFPQLCKPHKAAYDLAVAALAKAGQQ